MRKKIKAISFISACLLTSVFSNAFSAFEEAPASRWSTVVCTTTYPDGHETFHSACNSPSSSGPCDKIKNCW